MGRESASVKVLTIGVDLSLEEGDRVRIVGVLDGPEEDATACPVSVVEVYFPLQAEVKEVCLRKVEDVIAVLPTWCFDRHHRVKARDTEFEHPPQIVVPVHRFASDRGEGSVDPR